MAASIAVLASTISALRTPANAFDLSLDRTPLVACLDRLHTDGVLHAGLADFWNSRMLILLSRTGINHVALSTDGEPFRSSLSLRTSLGHDAPNHPGGPLNVDYILLQGLDRTLLEQRYGRPNETLRCAGQDIWRYPEGALRPHMDEIRLTAASRLAGG